MPFHIRRKDREITDADVLKSFEIHQVRYYCPLDNKPYLVPLSHGYDEAHNFLYFHCADEGKKVLYGL